MIELDAPAIKQILDLFPDCLDPRAKQIIEMRFGLNGNPKKTLQQIGDMFGICRERVRQIERKALRKIKHPSRLKNTICHTKKALLAGV
jgi:RNA polymerase primary sigma factor